MIALLVLCFTATVGNTNENNVINKVTNHLSNEKQKIIVYQKKRKILDYKPKSMHQRNH